MDTEEAIELPPEEEAPRKKRKPLLWAGLALALLAAIAVASLALFSGTSSDTADPDAAEAPSLPRKEAIYVSLSPVFTVNVQGESRARFLQVGVDVLTRDPDVQQAIREHGPMIRNNLVLLFSSKPAKELETREGKEALRAEALQTVRAVLEHETGNADVESLFFTSFVMQ